MGNDYLVWRKFDFLYRQVLRKASFHIIWVGHKMVQAQIEVQKAPSRPLTMAKEFPPITLQTIKLLGFILDVDTHFE